MNIEHILGMAAYQRHVADDEEMATSGFYEKYNRPRKVPKIEDYLEGWSKWDKIGPTFSDFDKDTFTIDGETYEIEQVDSWGGEGEGDRYGYRLKVNGKHFNVDATWVSWDGVYWGETQVYEVVPKQVTVTKWVRV